LTFKTKIQHLLVGILTSAIFACNSKTTEIDNKNKWTL